MEGATIFDQNVVLLGISTLLSDPAAAAAASSLYVLCCAVGPF